MSKVRKVLLVVLGMAVTLPLVGLGYEGLTEARDRKRFPMPGRMFDVGGYGLHIQCVGDGRPTVVFEAGSGGTSVDWGVVLDLVGRETRACAYDRAGFGWSESSPRPRDPHTMLAELNSLLTAAGETQPIVYAGHSFGGWMARLYASEYPGRVAGIVLVDAAHEDQWDRLPEAYQMLESAVDAMKVAGLVSRFGLLRVMNGSPSDASAAAQLRPGFFREFVREMEATDQFIASLRTSRKETDLPLAVVSAGRSFAAFPRLADNLPIAEANRRWSELQADLVTLSSNARHFVSPEATHDITRDDPILVVEAVLHVVEQVRSQADIRGHTALGAQETTLPGILPARSTPEVDTLLERLEREYGEMDVDGFVSLFTEDFTQHDVNRRVRVSGIEAWHEQTVRVNAGHRWMARVHGRRLVEGNTVIVEIEWSGLVRGAALGRAEDREYRYSGLGVLELDGGRIRSQVLYADFVTLAEQLGLEWGTGEG